MEHAIPASVNPLAARNILISDQENGHDFYDHHRIVEFIVRYGGELSRQQDTKASLCSLAKMLKTEAQVLACDIRYLDAFLDKAYGIKVDIDIDDSEDDDVLINQSDSPA